MEIPLKYTFSENCQMRNILSRLCNKWSVLILFYLKEHNTLRFGELEKLITDISPKVLTSTLRVLEEDLLISRQIYQQSPPKVEYSISEKGKIFFEKLVVFLDWTKQEIYHK